MKKCPPISKATHRRHPRREYSTQVNAGPSIWLFHELTFRRLQLFSIALSSVATLGQDLKFGFALLSVATTITFLLSVKKRLLLLIGMNALLILFLTIKFYPTSKDTVVDPQSEIGNKQREETPVPPRGLRQQPDLKERIENLENELESALAQEKMTVNMFELKAFTLINWIERYIDVLKSRPISVDSPIDPTLKKFELKKNYWNKQISQYTAKYSLSTKSKEST